MTEVPKKLEKKGLVTLDLETLIPAATEVAFIDLKDFLFRGLIVKETEFRAQVSKMEVESFRHKYVLLHCSVNAIIPMWAYMLLASRLASISCVTVFGKRDEADELLLLEKLEQMDWRIYKGQRVVLKGCGEKQLSPRVFMLATTKLHAVVRSLMFGEPCSTVPVFKKEVE